MVSGAEGPQLPTEPWQAGSRTAGFHLPRLGSAMGLRDRKPPSSCVRAGERGQNSSNRNFPAFLFQNGQKPSGSCRRGPFSPFTQQILGGGGCGQNPGPLPVCLCPAPRGPPGPHLHTYTSSGGWVLGVMIQGATRKTTLSWKSRAAGRSCKAWVRAELSLQPEPHPYCFPAGLCTPTLELDQGLVARVSPWAAILAYRVGRVQQGDSEGNEAREIDVWESQALHVEVHAVLATREIQVVTGLLWPQDCPVPGDLFAP